MDKIVVLLKSIKLRLDSHCGGPEGSNAPSRSQEEGSSARDWGGRDGSSEAYNPADFSTKAVHAPPEISGNSPSSVYTLKKMYS